jgi:hypothetical protein
MKTDFWKRHATVLALALIAISHPALGGDVNPVLIGLWPGDGPAVNDVAMLGTKAYVARAGGLSAIEISNPASPQQVATVGNFSASKLAVSGNLLVVSAAWSTDSERVDGLRLFDVADPSNPQLLSVVNTGRFTILDLALSGNYAYAADERGLHVLDISNPVDPKQVEHYWSGQVQSVASTGDYAYVANGWAGLEVLDISDLSRPRSVGGRASGRFAQAVAVSGHHAYVLSADETWWNDGFQLNVFNLDDPSDPQRVGDLTVLEPLGIPSLAVSGRYAYVASPWDGRMIDISDPARPLEVGRCCASSVSDRGLRRNKS